MSLEKIVRIDGTDYPTQFDSSDVVADCYGDVPETVDVDRLWRYDHKIRGDTVREDGSVLEVRYSSDGDPVDVHEVTNPSDVDPAEGRVLWRKGEGVDEVTA